MKSEEQKKIDENQIELQKKQHEAEMIEKEEYDKWKNTLETSGEDVKTHSKRVEKMS